MKSRKLNEYQAAGGIVYFNNRFLVLKKLRIAELRLPKGHIEPGETTEEAALREVGEEGGYSGLKISASLGSAISEFDLPIKNEHIRREEFYFLMEPEGSSPLERARDAEDQARFEPLWMEPQAALAGLTFEGERRFVRKAIQILAL